MSLETSLDLGTGVGRDDGTRDVDGSRVEGRVSPRTRDTRYTDPPLRRRRHSGPTVSLVTLRDDRPRLPRRLSGLPARRHPLLPRPWLCWKWSPRFPRRRRRLPRRPTDVRRNPGVTVPVSLTRVTLGNCIFVTGDTSGRGEEPQRLWCTSTRGVRRDWLPQTSGVAPPPHI